jgi:uncharacterized protein
MLILLSPAKTLDYETPPQTAQMSAPRLHAQAAPLIDILRTKSPAQIARLMELSDKLAAVNVARFQSWTAQPTPDLYPHAIKQAVLAFDGDVYDGLQARALDDDALAFAQKHVRILSGLYGLLRPLDLIQPYRLEMGRPLKNPRGKNLYAYWQKQVTALVNQDAMECGASAVINLASDEYFGAVDKESLAVQVIQPVFEELRPGGNYKVVSFMAKKARGLMARYVIDHGLQDAEMLKHFEVAGYRYAPQVSTALRWVFRRG